MPFEENESFKHKCAKEVLHKWLYEDYTGARWGGDGIYLEYPIVPAARHPDVGNFMAFNWSLGDHRYEYYSGDSVNFHPTYDQCVEIGDIPIAVIDVVETYKGVIQRGFEVYHTHKVNSTKLEKLKELTEGTGFELYEISAENILCQTTKPVEILKLCRRLI